MMAANSGCKIVIFELVLYLSTVTSVTFSELQSIAREVDNAIDKIPLPKNIKEVFSRHYINVGGYSNNIIELLDSYKTLSCYPIHFDDKEKSILTLSSSEDPIESKVRTQMKYYRKMQEVQCTDYLILYNLLNDANRDMQHIIQHVYNMIKMAYFGKFVVFAWILKLYINLLTPSDWNHDEWVLHLMREGLHDIKQYNKPLDELVNMCIEHKYLEERSCAKESFNQISEHDNFNIQLHHTHFNNNESPLPFSVDHLYLANVRRLQHQIEPITRSTGGWEIINEYFQNEISVSNEQLSTEDWKNDPFKNIIFQQMFLYIIKVKLYCFVLVPLAAYLSVVASSFKYHLDYICRLDYFMSLISEKVEFFHIKDKTLNEVLTLYSTLGNGKTDYEQNTNLCRKLITEINNSLNIFRLSQDTFLVDFDRGVVESELYFNSGLDNIEKRFLEFENFLKTSLDGYSFSDLLFFVNGSINTELAVFP